MAYIHFDSNYAPCCFLIVKDGGDPYKESDSLLVQSDFDWPAIADRMEWIPPEIDNGSEEFYAAAMEWIDNNSGISFPELDEYFNES